jgi:hypothetical protein
MVDWYISVADLDRLWNGGDMPDEPDAREEKSPKVVVRRSKEMPVVTPEMKERLREKAKAPPPSPLTERIDHIDDDGYVHWKEKK